MDKKQFMECLPDIVFRNTEIGTKIITILAKFYEVSQHPGFGTRYGGDWNNSEDTFQMARKEYDRLSNAYYLSIRKEREEREERIRRDAEFIRKFVGNIN
jgi:hypothetical protein